MVDFHNSTIFGVDRVTISKGERDGYKWVTVNLGGGTTFTLFKDSQSSDWPEVVVEQEPGDVLAGMAGKPEVVGGTDCGMAGLTE